MKPHRFVRPLTATEQIDVEGLYRNSPDAGVRRKARAIRLSAGGWTTSQIADILKCGCDAIHIWLDAFEVGGCDALLGKPACSTFSDAGPDVVACLLEAVRSLPEDFGYDFETWTLRRLRYHLARQVKRYVSDGLLRKVMKQEGIQLHRPKPVPAMKGPLIRSPGEGI